MQRVEWKDSEKQTILLGIMQVTVFTITARRDICK